MKYANRAMKRECKQIKSNLFAEYLKWFEFILYLDDNIHKIHYKLIEFQACELYLHARRLGDFRHGIALWMSVTTSAINIQRSCAPKIKKT